MSAPRRALRAFATLVMGAGIGAVAAGGVDLIRDGLTGPLANIVPNLSFPPLVILAGAVMVVGGAVLRRGVRAGASLPAPSDERVRTLKD